MRVLVRVLPVLCAIFVACASFSLSFVALAQVALRTEAVPADMAWLAPICVDGAVLAASASLWASSMRGIRKDPVAILTLVSLLTISVIININHAGPELLAKVIAALPPLTLLATLELVAGQYRRDAEDEAEAAMAQDVVAQPGLAPQPAPQPAAAQAGASPLSAPVPAGAVPGSAAPGSRAAADPVERDRLGEGFKSPRSAEAADAVRAVTEVAESSVFPEPRTAAVRTQAITSARTAAPRATEPSGQASPSLAATRPARPKPADEISGAVRIRERFQAHLDAGGAATDPSLARTFAADLKLQQAYVRKVLGPLRRELEPAV